MSSTNLNGEAISARLRTGNDEMGNTQAGDVTAGSDGINSGGAMEEMQVDRDAHGEV